MFVHPFHIGKHEIPAQFFQEIVRENRENLIGNGGDKIRNTDFDQIRETLDEIGVW